MKPKNIGILISGAVGGCFLALAPATAAILVEPIVTTPNLSFPTGVEIPFGLPPGQLTFWNAPDTTGEQNFLNSTGLDIDQFSLVLLPDFDSLADDVIWGDVNSDGQIGFSNIFTNVNIAQGFTFQGLRAPRIDLAGGVIPAGDRFVVQFITQPDLRPSVPGDNGPLVVGGVYFGSVPVASVPEPSTFFGSLVAMGLGNYFRKFKSDNKRA
ncbi:hypothetical protein Nos7524_3162 [Nostoc sp. PCC 7524]|uniref:PEP-CTERM sorting domain-containing protein n=1 Tax=Nostoc sp. (strain ATCC 29411 / PCC 7524) TaxID=28072 RepID=UPI00029EC3BD|nr:PEP-CTERM sorting domain-containing protein [Nostoc sp. PCC 7524]AFY48965.1 hypothetical protein Nos7524_3162 [Nostoc sp. PCC 7524]